MGALAGKRLSAITKAVVAKWHGDIAKDHGPMQANRCKALLATMFSKASDAVGYSGPNPCIGVANFPERSRERFLLPAEMKAFFRSLAAEDAYWQAFFLLCLFTGSRRGNIASMEWPEIDLDKRRMAHSRWQDKEQAADNDCPLCSGPGDPSDSSPAAERQPLCLSRIQGRRPPIRPTEGVGLASLPVCGDARTCNEIIGSKPRSTCPTCKATLPPAEPIDLHMHDLRRTQGVMAGRNGHISLAIIGKSLGPRRLEKHASLLPLATRPSEGCGQQGIRCDDRSGQDRGQRRWHQGVGRARSRSAAALNRRQPMQNTPAANRGFLFQCGAILATRFAVLRKL